MRRKLILALDAQSGEASFESTVRALQRLDQPIHPHLESTVMVSVNGCPALHMQDGVLTLDRAHEDTLKARARFRDWLGPRLQRQRESEQLRQACPAIRDRLMAGRLAEWQVATRLSRAVLAGYQDGESFALVVLNARTGEAQTFSDREQAAREVARYDIVAGLDPRGLFEKLGWSLPGALAIDLTPPFKSRPVGRDRRKSVTTSEAIEMTIGVRPIEGRQIRDRLAGGRQSEAHAALLQEAHNLQRLWRYGILHRGVRRDNDTVAVSWNAGKDFSLWSMLGWSYEDGRPVRLTMRDGRVDVFQRTDPEPKVLYTGEQVVLGQWKGSTRTEPLILLDVMDADYPYDIAEERVKKLYFW